MKIVMDKPSSPAVNESNTTNPASESSEDNNAATFLDFVMTNLFVNDAADSQLVQQSPEELAGDVIDQAALDVNAAVLAQVLIEKQKNNDQQASALNENNSLDAESEVMQAQILVGVNTQGREATQGAQSSTNEEASDSVEASNLSPAQTNNNANKSTNNSKVSARNNQAGTSNKHSLYSDDARAELLKDDVSSTSVATERSYQNVAKNQTNDMLHNNTIASTIIPRMSQQATSTLKAGAGQNVGSELLFANVGFHIDTLEHLKEKTSSMGVQHININVTPAELGPISARLKMIDGNRFELDIMAKNNDVVQVIKSQLSALREQFSGADIRLETINVNVQSQDSFSGQSDGNGFKYDQSIPMDYVTQSDDKHIKTQEKTPKTAETLIDAYV